MTPKEKKDWISAGLLEAKRIDDGHVPDANDLAGAPLISGWSIVMTPAGVWALAGVVTGHPEIVDGHRALTSAVLRMDRDAGWARTLSRYYKLGPKRGEQLQ